MLMEKRRQKISSPTIDSTTDDLCHTITQEMVANSQDSQGVSSTLKINGQLYKLHFILGKNFNILTLQYFPGTVNGFYQKETKEGICNS